MRFLYNFFLHLMLPFIPLRLWWRGLKEPLYRRDWTQRFGCAFPPRADSRPLIWLHAVSLGETRAAAPLLRALCERYPNYAFLVTHMTATGREAARNLYGDFAELAFLPYDFPWAVNRFMQHYKPALGLIVETEIWPNLLGSAADRDVPMALVNARLSGRSAKGYEKLGSLAKHTFGSFDVVAAQSQADAARLRALGARNVEVTGNLKFDLRPVPMEHSPFVNWFPGRRIFLAASTREGEEALLLDAMIRNPFAADVLVILVPRHPQRFDEVAMLLQKRQLSFSRRSEGPPKAGAAIFLGDSMGEMSAYYAAADVAFIGGSLLPYGAQNLIEACAQGAPVLLGPSTFNFAQAVELAVAAGAALQIENAVQLIATAQTLIDDPPRRAEMKEAGLAFCAAHRGATARTLALVESLLPA